MKFYKLISCIITLHHTNPTHRMSEKKLLAIINSLKNFIDRMREPAGTTNVELFDLNNEQKKEKIIMYDFLVKTFHSARNTDPEIITEETKFLHKTELEAKGVKLLIEIENESYDLVNRKREELEEEEDLVVHKRKELEKAESLVERKREELGKAEVLVERKRVEVMVAEDINSRLHSERRIVLGIRRS